MTLSAATPSNASSGANSFVQRITPEFVVRALHLTMPRAISRPHTAYTAVVTDSRKIVPGCLFIALKGDSFDGHDYITQAVEQGARGVVCKRGTAVGSTKEVSYFQCEDTLLAYRRIAAAWRREFSIPVVVVAGSVGKTTTKELLAAILHGRHAEVLKTESSQNGFVGIPMTLLGLKPSHSVAVIEVGIDEMGAMAQHLAVVAPTHAVVTCIGPEHLEKLRDIPTVAREEGIALAFVAKNGGHIAINMDDPWIRPHHTTLREGHKVPYSLNGTIPPGTAGAVTGELEGDTLVVTGSGLERARFKLPLPGRHNAANLLGAVSLAAGMGLTADEIERGLSQFKGAGARSELQQLDASTPVVCDYYNANPTSTEAALELLTQVAESRRKRWACLADMLELGPREAEYHRGLAPKIQELGVENVLLHGPRMLELQAELQKLSFAGRVEHFESHGDLVESLTQGARPGDAILIKGSRGMKMEEVWKGLQARWNGHASKEGKQTETS